MQQIRIITNIAKNNFFNLFDFSFLLCLDFFFIDEPFLILSPHKFQYISDIIILKSLSNFTDRDGEFVFGPLCSDRNYEIQVWASRVRHCKVCKTCSRVGKCLKGVELNCNKPEPPCHKPCNRSESIEDGCCESDSCCDCE